LLASKKASQVRHRATFIHFNKDLLLAIPKRKVTLPTEKGLNRPSLPKQKPETFLCSAMFLCVWKFYALKCKSMAGSMVDLCCSGRGEGPE